MRKAWGDELASGGHIGYRGPELLHLVITLWVLRSFTEKPRGVKLNRTVVISGKTTNRNKILDNLGRNKNIV